MLPSPSDPNLMVFRIYSQKSILGFRSYFFDHSTNTFLWGNGTHIFNSSIRIQYSPSTGQVTSVDIIDGPALLISDHTSFRMTDKYFILGCSSCNSSLGLIRVYEKF